MDKTIVLETQGLKQYFPINSKRDESSKLRILKQDILKIYAESGQRHQKFSQIVKTYLADSKDSTILSEALDLLEEYSLAKLMHGKALFVKANDGIDLQIFSGETVGIVGESGCGKSTYGRSLLKLYKPTGGRIIFEGNDITHYKTKQMIPLRTEMQIIFQDPYSSLDPRMTVGQIIGEALVEHEMYKKGSKKLEDYILEIMEICGLADYMIHRYPHEFSGGQRQRIGIARALALKPKFIVCDEAVSALDVSIQSQIINLLKDLQTRFGLAYLFISHDLSVVKHISDRVGVMYLGQLVELAPKNKMYANPQHPYTQALLSAIPLTDLDAMRTKKRIILEGDLPSNVIPPTGCKFHTRCPIVKDLCRKQEPKWEEVSDGHFVSCHFPG